ncbi:uncharacterized protein K452DRAFT_62230 [Aplosporella prunicola CBS 121167]|uniref:Uncharacterized protein n=1 Tax=Aplosporella prunicola CBS 121167 TaxID=1176127 RepID=A0A6A6B600_9PEZI|nr:uncharacterized protein K452DRAFT_62230 [Aplosporella prunicola CBS 121167]KAF2139552.1 hypothetical protein K452DRAFT_62230 [Aplosporella prunicola CBS 121167]
MRVADPSFVIVVVVAAASIPRTSRAVLVSTPFNISYPAYLPSLRPSIHSYPTAYQPKPTIPIHLPPHLPIHPTQRRLHPPRSILLYLCTTAHHAPTNTTLHHNQTHSFLPRLPPPGSAS